MRGKRFGMYLVALAIGLFGMVASAQAQAKPDLVVSRLGFQDDGNGFVKQVIVKVTNVCTESADASYVRVSFKRKPEPGAQTILTVGDTIPPLKPGESAIRTFPIEMKLGKGRHMLAEVDPDNTVSEANEDNNWRKVNPNGGPAKLSGSFQCSPKM